MKIRYIVILVAMLATGSLADDPAIDPRTKSTGTPIYFQCINSDYTKNPNPGPNGITKEKMFADHILNRPQLVQFSVSAMEGSSPQCYIVYGKVTDSNAGASWERCEILFSSPTHSLRLAGLTDARGEFRFRLWLKEDQRITPLQTPRLEDGVVYVSTRNGGSPDTDPRLGDEIAYAYSFKDLLPPATAAKREK